MTELNPHDLQFAIRRLPKPLVEIMKAQLSPTVFIGGGYLRSIVAGEFVNDIDCFCTSKENAQQVAKELSVAGRSGGRPTRRIYETDNALTVLDYKPVIQIIHRWNFGTLESLIDSFDFTNCAAAFQYSHEDYTDASPGWKSVCHPDFYSSIASKRLDYTSPVREEEAGGSMLRVLKYYQKGYRIPLDSFSKVIARLVMGVDKDAARLWDMVARGDDSELARVLCGLLREVDPSIDPEHAAHLPSAVDFAKEESSDIHPVSKEESSDV